MDKGRVLIPRTRRLCATGMVSNIGWMVLIMKGIGSTIRQKDKEPSGTLKVTFIEVTLGMIWPMVSESIPISMDRNTEESSVMIFKKAMAKRNGLTEQNMWALT